MNDERLARVLEFARFDIGAAVREAEEIAARRTPEEREAAERCRARLRLGAARYLLARGDERGRRLAIEALEKIRAERS